MNVEEPDGRWLYDCHVCGEPQLVHTADGACTRDPATYAQPRGIRGFERPPRGNQPPEKNERMNARAWRRLKAKRARSLEDK